MTTHRSVSVIMRAALLGAAVLAMGGCREAAGGGGASSPIVTVVPDSASNPTVAADPRGGGVYLAWVGIEDGLNGVYVARAEEGEVAPGPAVRANDIPGDAAPHLQAPAQVAVGPEGHVYVLWQNNTPIEGRRFPASDLRLAVSTDGGRSFAPAVTVNDGAGGPPSSHTFHDIAVAADGTVLVSWIDSRERDAAVHQRPPEPIPAAGGAHAHHGMAGAPSVPADHGHAAVGVDEAPGPEIRVARSRDGGRSFGPSVVVDAGSCPCCRTSLVTAPDGAVYVAWRKIFPGDVRDVVVARAEPGSLAFGDPVRVHDDEWVFPGCPHAGPSLAVADDGTLLVGWYTGREGRQGLWYAASTDAGRSFSAALPVLTADFVPPSQLRLSSAGGRVWAAWDDRTGPQPRVRLATGALGETLRDVEVAQSAPGTEPDIAATGRGAVAVWLDGAAVRTALVARPREGLLAAK